MQCKKYIVRDMLLPLMLLSGYEASINMCMSLCVRIGGQRGAQLYRRQPDFCEALKYNFSQMGIYVIQVFSFFYFFLYIYIFKLLKEYLLSTFPNKQIEHVRRKINCFVDICKI